MGQITALILAAGEGKRMKTGKAKVIHKLFGRAMIEYVCMAVEGAGIDKSALIVGHRAEDVMETMGGRVEYVRQENQLGTGHAVMQAERYFRDGDGLIFVLYGDTPLVTSGMLRDAVNFHRNGGFKATVITADIGDPIGYGRIIRDPEGNVVRIVEHRDATEAEREIREINSGCIFSAPASCRKP